MLALKAPTSGPMRGILFYQDPRLAAKPAGSSIAGSTDSTLEGVLYFPTSDLSWNGTADGREGEYLIIVADTITFTGSATMKSNYSGDSPLKPPVSITVTPATATLGGGQSQRFIAIVQNANSTAVTWSLSPNVGTIDSGGLYTAPAGVAVQQVVTVTATSQADPTRSASAAVTLVPGIAVSVAPASATLEAGKPQQFTATVANTSNTAVTWWLSPSGVGAISASGLYTAPDTIAAPQTVTVTATSQADPTKSASASITLTPSVSVKVNPASATLSKGQTQQFTATVANTSYTAVTWWLSPSGMGTINASGLYTAPAGIPAQQTVTVTATSEADPTKSGSATITLLADVSVKVTPANATLRAGETQQFTATVANTSNPAVTWSLSPNAGTITAVGLYTAPAGIAAEQTVTLTATSQADPTVTATATISLMPPVSVSVAPAAATLHPGQIQQFTATVGHASNTAVTWTVSPEGMGTISTGGSYTAPSNITAQQTATVMATSQADPTKSASATVTLLPPVALSLAPASVTLQGGQTQQFTPTVLNTDNTAVTWSLSPNLGTISAGGLYTAPAGIGTQQTVTVTATSQADASKSATATITLIPSVRVDITPLTVTLYSGQSQHFTATVLNTANTAVTWSLSPDLGTIGAGGLYTAPAVIAAQQTVTATATSQADPARSGSAAITLVPGVSVSVTPATATLRAGEAQQFTASVQNAGSTAVGWWISPNVGSISSTGLYTAPASITTQQTVTVMAVSQADNTRWASATVTLAPATLVTVSPGHAILQGGSQQFTANTAVIWSLSPAGVGTITPGGLHTPPATVTTQQTVVVVATSEADGTSTGVAVLTLLPAGNNALVLAPASSSRKTGTAHTLTAILTDANGAPIAGAAIAFTVTGVNPGAGSGTTDATGTATFAYAGANPGEDSAQAAFGSALSNTAAVSWIQQTANEPPTITPGSEVKFIAPGKVQLSATVTDDGVGTLVINWTKLSGPGEISFESPHSATTNAAITASGHYVLELSASDGELTTTAQVALDVQLGDPVRGGWIGGVEYGADVSGQVPITGGSPDNATVLNANTTGNGTIGTLDTTLLPNGAYWIGLDATDSTGAHQFNLCLVNVTGEYKPGRVTATVTDLTVPAHGLAIKIERRYDSLERTTSKDFGYGWSLGTRIDLEIDPQSNVTFTLGGRRRTFYFTPRPLFPLFPGIPLRLPAYTPEPGLPGTLQSGQGCFVGDFYFWDVLVQVGSLWICNTGGS